MMTAWDPAGVSDTAEAWDEYDRYLAGVALRLRRAADRDSAEREIADYLRYVETEFMGLDTDRAKTRNAWIGGAVAGWYEWSFKHAGGNPGTGSNSPRPQTLP